MPEGSIVVVAAGMQCAVGLSTPEVSASVRAGIMRFSESPWQDKAFQPFVLGGIPDDGLADLSDELVDSPGLSGRVERMLRIGTPPLDECCAAFLGQEIKTPLALALPDRETQLPLRDEQFLEWYAVQTENAFDLASSQVVGRGRAAGLAAVNVAAEWIAQGSASFAIAAGIDTYRDAFVLGTLDLEERIASASNHDGFIPAEGAASLLLTSNRDADRLGLRPLARISRASEGFEAGHLFSDKTHTGDGLADAVRPLTEDSLAEQPIREVFSSMNGERYWAREWGVAYLRNRSAFAPDVRTHHPADCFGDVGAAFGPLMIGLAAMGMQEGYRDGPCMICASSDFGFHGALLVARPAA